MSYYMSEQVLAEALELSSDPDMQNIFGEQTASAASSFAATFEAFRTKMLREDLEDLKNETQKIVVKLTGERQ